MDQSKTNPKNNKMFANVFSDLKLIIIKINNIDVTQLPQEEMVQMFLNARNETMLLEVKHVDCKSAGGCIASSSMDVSGGLCTKLESLQISPHHSGAVDTKITTTTLQKVSGKMIALAPFIPKKEEGPVTKSLTTKTATTSTQTEDDYFYDPNYAIHAAKVTTDRLIAEEHNLFEQCLAPELDIQQVTLRKSNSNERLGLTVCYSSSQSNNGSGGGNSNSNNNINCGTFSGSDENEACAEVYISDIQEDSIAGRDGRLRQGDQILQINGKDVKSKEETEALIAENANEVTLLVSRYLYTDEDFNEPCVVDVLDVEDYEEEEEEEEEYYDENNLNYENCFMGSDLRGINVSELDKILLSPVVSQREGASSTTIYPLNSFKINTAKCESIDPKINSFNNEFLVLDEHASRQIGPVRSDKNNESSERLRGIEKFQNEKGEQSLVSASKQKRNALKSQFVSANLQDKNLVTGSSSRADYDGEHIYETIPEDSEESEPFYCSPYESAAYIVSAGGAGSSGNSAAAVLQKQRVAQWLGIKSNYAMASSPGGHSSLQAPTRQIAINRTNDSGGCGGSLHGRSFKQGVSSSAVLFYRCKNSILPGGNVNAVTITNGTSSSGGVGIGIGACVICGNCDNCVCACALAQCDEHDNSSSAYNTGGSNNSTTAQVNSATLHSSRVVESFVTSSNCEDLKSQGLPLSSTPTENPLSPKNGASANPAHNKIGGGSAAASTSVAQLRSSENHTRFVMSAQINASPVVAEQRPSVNLLCLNSTSIISLQQQQQMYKQQQKLQQKQQQQQSHNNHDLLQQPTTATHFTAPNLSQYHFVSSQEVKNAAPLQTTTSTPVQLLSAAQNHAPQHSASDECVMVWKVKRRQDGTRYIVRRPARNRVLRDQRSARMIIERERERNRNDPTTTEDDTISEVKKGRYWSKEERKKHFERSRERRQQQQLQQQQMQLKSNVQLQNQQKLNIRLLRQQHLQQVQPQQPIIVSNSSSTSNATFTVTATTTTSTIAIKPIILASLKHTIPTISPTQKSPIDSQLPSSSSYFPSSSAAAAANGTSASKSTIISTPSDNIDEVSSFASAQITTNCN